MNVSNVTGTHSLFVGNQGMLWKRGLKSTQERLERQEKCNNQIAYWEEKKEQLKETESDSLEGIARKLNTLQEYEDQITAAKEQYNNEQLWHLLDEAKEIREKIAEEAEKLEPKTAEERLEDMAEEALGADGEKDGVLTEEMEELKELAEELTEEMTEESLESLEEYTEELQEAAAAEPADELEKLQVQTEKGLQQLRQMEKAAEEEKRMYQGFDMRI